MTSYSTKIKFRQISVTEINVNLVFLFKTWHLFSETRQAIHFKKSIRAKSDKKEGMKGHNIVDKTTAVLENKRFSCVVNPHI